MALTPILLAGYGRSATTALMELLGRDSRVAFDRRYPFEFRYLTYFAKLAALAASRDGPLVGTGQTLCDYPDGRISRFPWTPEPVPADSASLSFAPGELAGTLWSWASDRLRRSHPGATHYAEKAPHWLPAAVAGFVPCRVIRVTRDPRDIFLSARAFNERRDRRDFGAADAVDDVAHARALAHALVAYAENESACPDPNVLRVRYEDFIFDSRAVTDRLAAALGLDFTGDAVPTPADHRTAPEPAASVGRWKREVIAPAARRVLERQLAGPMTAAGYELPELPRPPTQLDLSSATDCSPDGSLTGHTATGWHVSVSGADFWLELLGPHFHAEAVHEIWLCVTAGRGDRFSVYWHGPRESFHESRCVHADYRPGPHWEIVRVRLAGHPLWKGRIDGLRLDLFNGEGTVGTGTIRWVRVVE